MNPLVDQRVYFAKVLLDAADACEMPARPAFVGAAVLQLLLAYRAYLYEITDDMRLCEGSAADALRHGRDRGLPAVPELGELAALERSGAWPQRLLSAHRLLTAPTAASSMSPTASSTASTGIAALDLSDEIDVALCRDWVDRFEQIVQRQREHAREY